MASRITTPGSSKRPASQEVETRGLMATSLLEEIEDIRERRLVLQPLFFGSEEQPNCRKRYHVVWGRSAFPRIHFAVEVIECVAGRRIGQ